MVVSGTRTGNMLGLGSHLYWAGDLIYTFILHTLSAYLSHDLMQSLTPQGILAYHHPQETAPVSGTGSANTMVKRYKNVMFLSMGAAVLPFLLLVYSCHTQDISYDNDDDDDYSIYLQLLGGSNVFTMGIFLLLRWDMKQTTESLHSLESAKYKHKVA